MPTLPNPKTLKRQAASCISGLEPNEAAHFACECTHQYPERLQPDWCNPTARLSRVIKVGQMRDVCRILVRTILYDPG